MTRLPLKTRIALEIERRFRRQKTERHPLEQLFWECTLRCNLHCLHCGSDCKSSASTPDMPAEDFLRVIDSITPHVDPHHLMIIISGGEPLMRQDLEEIGKALYEREYPWGIVTNGMMLTQERLKSLIAAGMQSITISIDGFEDEHNWLRGNKQSYQHAINAIHYIAQEPSLKWDVVTCVNGRNYPHLASMRDAYYEAGVRNWRLFSIFPVGRAAQHPDLQLTSEQLHGLLQFIEQTRGEGRINTSFACEGFLGKYEGRVRNHLYSCQAGISVASILADGSISSCMSIRYDHKQGNIYKDDFMEVWNNRFERYRNREWAHCGECEKCTMWRYCEGGPMHLHDDNGHLLFCHLHRLEEIK